VIPPGRSAPHGVGVHDAQVLALFDCTASPGSDLKLHKKILTKKKDLPLLLITIIKIFSINTVTVSSLNFVKILIKLKL
jgi:hypothetical protein